MKSIVAACGLVALLMVPQADASIITGTFTGIAESSHIGVGPGAANFDGSVVTGSFSLDLAGALSPDLSGTSNADGVVSTGYLYTPPHPTVISLTFNAVGMTVSFGTEFGAGVTLSESASGQTIGLAPDVLQPLHSALLTLAGPPGSFFSDTDIATFHPGPIDLENSTASFFASRDFGATIALTDLEAPGFTLLAIQEPGTGLLFASCLGIFAVLCMFGNAPPRRRTGRSR